MFDQNHLKLLSEAFQQQQRALAEKAAAEEHEKRLEATTRVLSALYDRAATYTNIVIIGGYAVAFTIWTTMKPGLSKRELIWSGLLFLFSALSFIMWECSVMIYNSENLRKFAKALEAKPADFDAALKNAYALEANRNIRIRRFWFASLLLTIVPGAAGAAVLIGSFIRQLLTAT